MTVSNLARNLQWHPNMSENLPLFAYASWLLHETIIVKNIPNILRFLLSVCQISFLVNRGMMWEMNHVFQRQQKVLSSLFFLSLVPVDWVLQGERKNTYWQKGTNIENLLINVFLIQYFVFQAQFPAAGLYIKSFTMSSFPQHVQIAEYENIKTEFISIFSWWWD